MVKSASKRDMLSNTRNFTVKHYRFLSTKDLIDNIFVAEAVLFFIFDITAEVKNISKMLAVKSETKIKHPWHKDFPMMLSYLQNFFLRLYPPGVK